MSHRIARPASSSTTTLLSVMTARAMLALVALVAMLAGCSARQSAPPSHGPGQGTYQAPSAESYGGAPSGAMSGAPSAAPADAPSRMSAESEAPSSYDRGEAGGMDDGAYREQAPEQPRERPGLGTVFGETRASSVRRAPFVRAGSQPFAGVVLHYNDMEGVRAHAQYLGQGGLVPFHAHTPAGGIEVTLADEYGNVLQGGATADRNLIVGQEGQRYEIIVRNQTAGRYEVVGSVDGLDVIDGLPAHFEKRGYVLEPHGALRIEGWRRSTTEVAAFRFGRVSESYAGRTTGDRNVGVIGVAFFAEQGSAWTTDELQLRDSANPFPAQSGYAQPPQY
jgi:hypothetical protein